MYFLYGITGLAVLVSLIVDRRKTVRALQIAAQRLLSILTAFSVMLVLAAVILFFLPDEVIFRYLGGHNRYTGMLLASLIGAIALMPGFIVFPLCGLLLEKGVSYMVLSAFTTSLMMVGFLTYPIEKQYFGAKVTLVRNTAGFLTALFVAIVTGLFFGEVLR